MNALAEFKSNKVRVNRIPRSPLDICTIVSISARAIYEEKITVNPSVYNIEAAEDGDYSLLVVKAASWLKEMEIGEVDIYQEIPIGSISLANSIITDYCSGLLGYKPGIADPGLFCVAGEHTKKTLEGFTDPITKKAFKVLLEEARVRQRNWYSELVLQTDKLWARTNGNPIVVGEDAKIAAIKLNLNRDWMHNFASLEKINCKACGNLVNPAYPICPNCKAIINEEKAKAAGIKFAS
jgi:hypothetical protein